MGYIEYANAGLIDCDCFIWVCSAHDGTISMSVLMLKHNGRLCANDIFKHIFF